ncbi:NGG1p interacting factor 3 protein, NIF3 [Sphaerochaeta globosa str. Buddy]|uniref:GTP cyclohydrolase 1 type 2 homolog n=2 Tax=Sphaerochaeta TaxID=399320 RepID=F0RTN7_SPHGB|nr:NGG1p interacting factor 3 protein, NIF3 [Sphaerochaeta globosa str. Buddy]
MTMKRSELVSYLDAYLEVASFTGIDRSLNSLVVGPADRQVGRVAFAVDACQSTFEEAIKAKADLLVVHHGLFWGEPLAVCGPHYTRLKTLIEGNLDLYAAHLPLDAHPEVGNNSVMARKLGLKDIQSFAPYKGCMLGCKGNLGEGRTAQWIAKQLGFVDPVILPFGNELITQVGIVSGGASSDVLAAMAEGLDCFITGEFEHQNYHDAAEGGITVIAGGHYMTETFGLQALMEHLKQKFGLQVIFVANPTGL